MDFSIVYLYSILAFTHGGPHQSCPAGSNEVIMLCGPACGEPTCTDPSPRKCTEPCKSGCFCDVGFVRDGNGKCVQLKDCNPSCPANEVYKACDTSCPPTCSNPNPEVCPLDCTSGCFCADGFVRDDVGGGACVDPNSCNACPPNEEYVDCMPPCARTCADPFRTCEGVCRAGCVCTDGYVRDDESWICTELNECIHTCPAGEQYNECGTSCPPTCNQPNPQFCTEQCVAGCFCNPGLVRNENDGSCVALEDCTTIAGNVTPSTSLSTSTTPTHQCGENEEYVHNPHSATTAAPHSEHQKRQSSGGCQCNRGYVRGPNKRCVQQSKRNKSNGNKSSGDSSSGEK